MQKIPRGAVLLALLILVAVFQLWFMDVHFSNLSHRTAQPTLIDSYARALSEGESSLLGQTDQGEHRILDASYFNGRVYIYYGIGPFFLLLLPWLVATGTYLSPAVCIIAALLAGYAAYGCALLLIFRRDQRPVVTYLIPAAFLTVICGSGTWSLLDMPNIHQLESAFGYACTGAAIAGLAAAVTCERRRTLALSGAAFATGLIMACRPNCFPAVFILALTTAGLGWKFNSNAPRAGRTLLLIGAPLLLIAVALAAFNYVRFGSILEFGMHYGTGAEGRPAIVAFSSKNVLYNLHRYLFGGVRWGGYFPFINGPKEGPLPRPLETHESAVLVYGCFLLFPVLLFAAIALWKRGAISALLLAAAAGNLLLLSGLGFGTYRYATDYLGLLSFVAALGVGLVGEIYSRVGRTLLSIVLVVLLSISGTACLCQTVAISAITARFDVSRAKDFATLAWPFNHLSYQLEKIGRAGPRALRAEIKLPENRNGQVEPLLVAGDPGLQDFLYFYYTSPSQVQVGFESIGQGGPVSAPFQIDYAQPHVIDISMGSLLPPDDHPLLRETSPGDRAIARRFLHVAIDGVVVLEGLVHLHPVRSRLLWGESPDDAAFGKVFTGTISRVEQPSLRATGIYPKWQRALFGPLSIKLQVPSADRGAKLPLIAVGNRPSGGILLLECLPSNQARLIWTRLNGTSESSDPFAWSYDQIHSLEFQVGSLLPPLGSSFWSAASTNEEQIAAKRTLRSTVDGREVWRAKIETPDVAPTTVKVGANAFFLPGVRESIQAGSISAYREAW